MSLAALAFALGAALLQVQAALPGIGWSWLLLLLPGMIFIERRSVIPVALAMGFLWASACAHWRMADWLDPALEGRDVAVTGVVSSLPTAGERSVRFEFDVESAEGARLPSKVLLSWYANAPGEESGAPPPEVHPGERWTLVVRLRRPHGLVNPHGFDYEAWLLERGIGATGYVRNRDPFEKLAPRNSAMDRVEQAREAARDRILGVLGPTPAAGVLAALAVGDQRSIGPEEWRLFARTGVTHLMSISGLHVTLVSGLAAWLVGFGWRRVAYLALRVPARKSAAVAAIFGALGYTLLA